jgi:AcrR family transcriptional regulator
MAPPITPLEWVRPPQQARSQQTLERILRAAEALIAEKGVEQTTVAEIARRAESSVGACYARFADKEALLRSVFERFFEQAAATAESVLAPERWHGQPTADVVASLVSFMLRTYRDRRGLIVGLALRAAREPELAGFGERLGTIVAERVYALLEARGEVLDHPRPKEAVHFCVWLVLSALEARALHSTQLAPPISEDCIAEELVRVALAYLGLAPAEATPLTT